MGMHKAVKAQFGGGMQRFSCEEDNIYENIESELCFFTSQVRTLSFLLLEDILGTVLYKRDFLLFFLAMRLSLGASEYH